MEKLKWCIKQKRGINIVKPNDNLFREYIENAEESLRVMNMIKDTRSGMWLATTKYYIEYFAFYSLLMKLGIKCEIHDCTIEVARLLEDDGIVRKGTAERLGNDKELRIDNQYYLKNRPVDVDMKSLRKFVLEMKTAGENISAKQAENIRSYLPVPRNH